MLRRANHEFERRFLAMEALVAADGVRPAVPLTDAQDACGDRTKATAVGKA
jgi:hypothetical protein